MKIELQLPPAGSPLASWTGPQQKLASVYFDIIREFGLHENNHDPMLAKTQALSISLRLPGHGCTTAYGETVEQVCASALDWLLEKGWRSETEKLEDGLYAFAKAGTSAVDADSAMARGVEIMPRPVSVPIHLNGTMLVVPKDVLTYQEIVDLADTQWGNKALHSVTYHHRVPFDQLPGERGGMLRPGQSVKVTPGMYICAAVTGNA